MPRLLDLFCGAGGASMGYHRVGFDVTGVDHKPQKHYPFPFILADALEYVRERGREYDAIHASPPCQAYSAARVLNPSVNAPRLIPAVRTLLREIGRPYVIENVPGAPLLAPVVVCGLSFGLGVKRHRLFESSLLLFGTDCPDGHPGDWKTVTRHDRGGVTERYRAKANVRSVNVVEARMAMGIDWMTADSLGEAIPPAYTEWIGRQLMQHLVGKDKL